MKYFGRHRHKLLDLLRHVERSEREVLFKYRRTKGAMQYRYTSSSDSSLTYNSPDLRIEESDRDGGGHGDRESDGECVAVPCITDINDVI
ncbi:hypothetical protein B1748_15050 [Paenibacillus sp. MY03]|jgi:hypothetical protein|nr:hypothetical protein B1748_15050 [Paenibacillus sp. MY03]